MSERPCRDWTGGSRLSSLPPRRPDGQAGKPATTGVHGVQYGEATHVAALPGPGIAEAVEKLPEGGDASRSAPEEASKGPFVALADECHCRHHVPSPHSYRFAIRTSRCIRSPDCPGRGYLLLIRTY